MECFKGLLSLVLVLAAASLPPKSSSRTVLSQGTYIAQNSIVERTCKNTPNYELCVSILQADPRSASADVTGLALIMVDKIKSVAMDALTKINATMQEKPDLKKPLDSCEGSYKAVVDDDVPMAIEALSKGVPKYAENGVADAGVEAAVCEGEFGGKASPLADINKSMHDITEVARAIVRMLL